MNLHKKHPCRAIATKKITKKKHGGKNIFSWEEDCKSDIESITKFISETTTLAFKSMNKKPKKINSSKNKSRKESKKTFKNKTKPLIFSSECSKKTYETSTHESTSPMISPRDSKCITREYKSGGLSENLSSIFTNSEVESGENDETLSITIGSTLKEEQYIIQKKLGSGAFSTVWLAWDKQHDKHVALKVQNCSRDCLKVAQEEIKIHQEVAACRKKDGEVAVVTLLDHFDYNVSQNRKHVCMVFEYLGDNLLTLIKANKHKGLPLYVVKGITKYILVGLNYLHNDLKIIHTDLKPENILLTSPLDPHHDPRIFFTRKSDNISTKNIKKNFKKYMPKREKKLNDFYHKSKNHHQYHKHDNYYNKNLQKLNLVQNSFEPPLLTNTLEIDNCANDRDKMTMIEVQSYLEQDERLAIDSDPDIARNDNTNIEFKTPSPNHKVEYPQTSTYLYGESPHELGLLDLRCKIIDLGSACWTHKILTSDIQTRPYRCPEVVLGCNYSTSADMWSFGCLVFELATGNTLFDPQTGGSEYNRDEDHLAQMMEILGPIPKSLIEKGANAHHYFTKNGKLKHTKPSGHFPIHKLLVNEYGFDEINAKEFAKFILPLLELNPNKRPNAACCLEHPWLKYSTMDSPQHLV